MPVLHPYTVKAGTTSKRLLVFIEDEAAPGRGKTGLSHATEGAHAAYVREGAAVACSIPLVSGALGTWAGGAFVEVDAGRMPGVYQLGAPDAMLAEGSTRAMLMLRFPGAFARPVEIDLVAYDPQDSERIGVWSLASSKRHEFLRRALPRFTEMELDLGKDKEQELADTLANQKAE